MIEAFVAIDLDRSGTITRDEVAALLQQLNIPCRMPALQTLLDIVDTDESGQVDYREFANVLTTDRDGLERMLMGRGR